MKKETPKLNILSKWKNRDKKDAISSAINKAPEGAVIPLSHGQRRLYFLQLLYPESNFYNYSERYEFEGNVQVEKLLKALKLACEAHEILRSTYHMEDGELFIKVNDEANIKISQHDFSSLEHKEAEVEANEILTVESRHIFNLAAQPSILVSLIKIHNTKHILLFTLHHIATDKWSMGLLRKDWAENYEKLCSDKKVNNKQFDIQYADFAYWQQNQKVDKKQLDYWKHKLSGEIPFISLPIDFPKPAKPSFKGSASPTHNFTKELSKSVLDVAKELEVTPYVLFLSVYYVLLFRYSGQKDILIGSPVANRDQKALENLVGFFNETVVLRLELSGAMSFKELVAEVKKTTLEAFSNKDVPFDTLVKELNQERSLSINPFFQVMFLYHSVPENPSFGPNIQLEHGVFDTGVSKFDLTLYVSEKDGILSSTFEYASDLFKASSVHRFQEHINLLLEGIVQNQEQSISELPILTKKENQFFLEQNIIRAPPFDKYNGIHEVIANISKKYPDAIAISFQDDVISYRELDKRANLLAKKILSKTQNKNEIVGLCIDRSIEMIVGMIGILKAGCAYLPIDPKYPNQRIQFILNDAEVDLVITQSKLTTLFSDIQSQLIQIDDEIWSDIHDNLMLPEAIESNLAYIIYTSGSTGNPKGVPITHKNILNSTGGRLQFYDKNPEAFLLMSSISFDSSKVGIFWTLCTGGNLVITENRIEQYISRVEEVIQNNNITHSLMLPSLYKLILEYGNVDNMESLTTVIVAGETCPTSLCVAHFDKFNTVDLYNEYGPTEATVWCIAHKVEKPQSTDVIPLGKPVANAEIYLLDEYLNKVPFGAVGEIYVGGIGLALKYNKRPDLTDKAYIKNPFGNSEEEKFYKTGDLARYTTDGTIEFLGRSDQQIKIRGYRVELGEIEKAIEEEQDVNDAVVLAETFGVNGSKRLVAYFTANERLNINGLKSGLKARLPDYMVPSSLLLVEEILKLPNGKVDKIALKDLPKKDNEADETNTVFPTNEKQAQLLDLWKEVLQIDSIGIHDNFFELGGDSILSIQIIAKARKIGLNFSPNDLFEQQTIAQLEVLISDVKDNSQEGSESFTGRVPLSPIQHWFFETHKKMPHFWNQAFLVNGLGNIKKEKVKQATEYIIGQHDVLRSIFEIIIEEGWTAKVLEAEGFNAFFDFDFSEVMNVTTDEKIKTKLENIQSDVKLESGPLFRCLYFDTGAGNMPKIILLAHHLVVDVVSWKLILDDFVSFLSQEGISNPRRTTSVLTWGKHLEELASSDELDEELSFWNKEIAHLTVPPTDLEKPLPVAEKNIETLSYTLDLENTKALTFEANDSYNTKTDELLMTAVTMTLSTCLGINSISYAIERHGRETLRTNMDLSNTIGWFTSFFPITMITSSNDDYAKEIISVKEKMRNIPNGGLGYGILRYLTDKLGNADYPQVVFNFLGNKNDGEFEFLIEGMRHPLSERDYLIEINTYIENGALFMKWSFSTEHYLEKTIVKMIANFDKTLKAIIDHCTIKGEGKFTPSDFPELDLGQDGLDDLLDSLDL